MFRVYNSNGPVADFGTIFRANEFCDGQNGLGLDGHWVAWSWYPAESELVIVLPLYNIRVITHNHTFGTITSDLGSGDNDALDGIEAMILAMACQGIDINTPDMITAIKCAVDAAINNG